MQRSRNRRGSFTEKLEGKRQVVTQWQRENVRNGTKDFLRIVCKASLALLRQITRQFLGGGRRVRGGCRWGFWESWWWLREGEEKSFCFSSLILGDVSSSVDSTCGVNQSSGEYVSRWEVALKLDQFGRTSLKSKCCNHGVSSNCNSHGCCLLAAHELKKRYVVANYRLAQIWKDMNVQDVWRITVRVTSGSHLGMTRRFTVSLHTRWNLHWREHAQQENSFWHIRLD